jgi:hypothetical protein
MLGIEPVIPGQLFRVCVSANDPADLAQTYRQADSLGAVLRLRRNEFAGWKPGPALARPAGPQIPRWSCA